MNTVPPACALLKVRDLHVVTRARGASYEIVSGLDLDLAMGDTLALVGESGCGKSMTALALMGLLPSACKMITSTYDFDGIDIARASSMHDALRGNRVAMIFQDPNTAFNPSFTIGNQLEEVWLRHRSGGRAVARERAAALLERVGISSPERRLKQYPHELSGGLRQRAMVAMALMCEPRLLIADEPTTALDVTIQAQVLRLLKELQRELGLGMILISHDIGVVAAMADRIACMYAGQIVETGPTSEVLAHPRHPYTRGLMRCLPGTSARQARLETIAGSVPPPEERVRGCRFANRCALVIEACESAPVEPIPLSPDRTVRCLRADYVEPMKQRTLPNEGHAATERNGDPILQANAVSHTFKVRRSVFAQAARLQALQGVSLELHRNETVAIVGESGCGKSTLARIALGLLTPTSGSVRIAGGALDALPRREIARLVQPVFQDPYASLAPHRSVVHAVMVPLQVLRIGATAERRWRALQMLEKVGLPGHMADRLPSELSGGQQQRVAIARALVLRPPVLICDEPTSALDVSVQAQILNLLRDLKQEFALSMLLITHNIGVVRQIADRVVVMYLGRIVEEGPVDTVLDHSKHPYTRLLVSSVLEPQRSNDVTPELGEDTQFPDPFNPPSGCAFHPRCVHRSAICTQVAPAERALEPGFVACHHPLPNITSHTREQEWNLTN